MTRRIERPLAKEGHRWMAELFDPLVLTASGADARRAGPTSVLLISSDRRDHSRVGSPLFDGGSKLQYAYTIEQAVPIISAGSVDVVVTAEHITDGSWLTLWSECNKRMGHSPDIAFIVLLGHSDVKCAVDVLKQGASDTITDPIDHARLLRAVSVAHARVVRARELRHARMSNPAFQTAPTARVAEEQS